MNRGQKQFQQGRVVCTPHTSARDTEVLFSRDSPAMARSGIGCVVDEASIHGQMPLTGRGSVWHLLVSLGRQFIVR